ncbi:MAG: hypothetical protein QT00_C0002G0319 [archaeon GW2011_AR5]|nr:MAG: hypothetical protein QT00_C0002G0319 [archaeon GW2011_AR5]
MQFKKLVAAGTLAALMVGSSAAFAALSEFPRPFVTSDGVQSFVVVGAAAAPSDVVGAVDIAARIGGSVTTDVSVPGAAAGFTIEGGDGKEVATTNTKLYLDDSLGKSGVRSTMTKDDLPTLLKTEKLEDTDGSTTHNYQQFIYLTPSSTSSANYKIEFEKPGSSSSVDPTYDMGRFTTSPTDLDYLYRTYVTFDKDVNMSTAKGERLNLFGRTYTVHTDSTGDPAGAGATTDKLVLSGGASETAVLSGGESIQVTVSGVTYDVTFKGASDANTAVVAVGSDQNNIDEGQSKKVGGLDVFVERVFDLSSTDLTQDSVKVQFGAQKVVLTNGAKVKIGDAEDSVDGTYVNLTISGRKLSAFQVAVGGRSSNEDFIKAAGGMYVDPVWNSFGVNFLSVTPGLTDASRDMIKVSPSGDNLIQVSYTDDRGYEKTINWAYKALSTDTVFDLADSSNNSIVVVEGTPVPKDAYFLTTAGEFSHMFRVTGISADGSSSASADLTDQFSGATLKLNLGTGNDESKVIDGQTFYVVANSTHLSNVTWGGNSGFNNTGYFTTVFPTLKGRRGERLALFKPNATVSGLANSGSRIDLPTGALNFTFYEGNGGTQNLNITAVAKEDGQASALAAAVTGVNASNTGAVYNVTLGRTATGGLIYALKFPNNNRSVSISVVGSAAGVELSRPGVLIVEEKDDNSDQYSFLTAASSETSGSNNVAIPGAPDFTASEDSAALGSESSVTDYVDLYGAYARRTTSGQDIITFYYPDDQVTSNVFVLAKEATVTQTSGGTGSTVKSATPVKTALGKLDSEVTSADKSTKHLILVGGPAVNTLVAELATAGKTRDTAWYRSQGAGTALVDLVENAFTSGRTALVVAGHSAADTRSATSRIQNYDAYTWATDRVVLKNGVVTTETA